MHMAKAALFNMQARARHVRREGGRQSHIFISTRAHVALFLQQRLMLNVCGDDYEQL